MTAGMGLLRVPRHSPGAPPAVPGRDFEMETPELMTMGDFLARYSIGRTTAYREVAAGRLKIRKLGNATRIARTDAEAWASSLPIREGQAA